MVPGGSKISFNNEVLPSADCPLACVPHSVAKLGRGQKKADFRAPAADKKKFFGCFIQTTNQIFLSAAELDIVNLMNNKEHLTIEGLHKIVAIKASPEEATPPRFVS